MTFNTFSYTPPVILFNGHLETIYPALVRRVILQSYTRERIETPDHDFLDIDWIKQNSANLVILSHGLEGSSDRAYVKGMAKVCVKKGFDVLAWNYRGCSGHMNRQLRFYHSGATDDLATVISHANKTGRYNEINLVGFSLGGNLTLKYLGEIGEQAGVIKKAVTFSVPLNLHTSCLQISKSKNWIYTQRFLRNLRKKVMMKSKTHKELDIKAFARIKTLMDFDDIFTGPLHGFKNAVDYYEQCSSIHFIRKIKVPTLIVNAQNDPMLSPECYPTEASINNRNIQFEKPTRGGHVGFTQFNRNGLYWSEERAIAFLES